MESVASKCELDLGSCCLHPELPGLPPASRFFTDFAGREGSYFFVRTNAPSVVRRLGLLFRQGHHHEPSSSTTTPMATNVHITPRANGWAVISAGAGRAATIASTQAAATAIGRQMAQNRGSELFIHGRNGQIRERNTYGSDPESSRG